MISPQISQMTQISRQTYLSGTEESQVINYLKATQLSRGLLLNFGAPSLEHKRFIFTHRPDFHPSAQSVESADVSRTP